MDAMARRKCRVCRLLCPVRGLSLIAGGGGAAAPDLTAESSRAVHSGSAPLEDLPSAHVLMQRAGAAREGDGAPPPSRPAAAPSLASSANDNADTTTMMEAEQSKGAPRSGLPHTATLPTTAPDCPAGTPLAVAASNLGPSAVPGGTAAVGAPATTSAAAAAGPSPLPGAAPELLPPLQDPVPPAGTDGTTTADPPLPPPLLRPPDAAQPQLHHLQQLPTGGRMIYHTPWPPWHPVVPARQPQPPLLPCCPVPLGSIHHG